MGLGRFLVRKVERLRIIFLGEGENFLAGDVDGTEIGLGADNQVFEMDRHGGDMGERFGPCNLAKRQEAALVHG